MLNIIINGYILPFISKPKLARVRLIQSGYKALQKDQAQVNTQIVVDLIQSLGWKINQEKYKLKLTQVFSFVGYEYHLDSALVKPTQERKFNLQDLILRLKSKHVLTVTCLMSLIWLLASTEKMVPDGTFT